MNIIIVPRNYTSKKGRRAVDQKLKINLVWPKQGCMHGKEDHQILVIRGMFGELVVTRGGIGNQN